MKDEFLFKVLVIGDLGVGKTSFIRQYVQHTFTNNYRATIGVDFALKIINWDENTVIRLQLWDIAGQERYGNMTRVYYKDADAAFVVFDVTRKETMDSAVRWKKDLDSKILNNGEPIPTILLANKCDQIDILDVKKIDSFCREFEFSKWMETSAKTNWGIHEAAEVIIEQIFKVSTHKKNSNDDNSVLSLQMDQKGDNESSRCQC